MSEQKYDYDFEGSQSRRAPQPSQSNQPGEALPPVAIAPSDLSPTTLESLIEAFVLREGTDYGAVEASFETKTSQVRRQLEEGLVQIAFDPNTETVTILAAREWKQLASRNQP
jgi:uncharacterized protein YheU (UPF0270 family)